MRPTPRARAWMNSPRSAGRRRCRFTSCCIASARRCWNACDAPSHGRNSHEEPLARTDSAICQWTGECGGSRRVASGAERRRGAARLVSRLHESRRGARAAAEAATITENGMGGMRDIPRSPAQSSRHYWRWLAAAAAACRGFGHVWDAAQPSQPFADAPGRRRRLLFNTRSHRTAFCGTALSVSRVGVAHCLNARSTTNSHNGTADHDT